MVTKSKTREQVYIPVAIYGNVEALQVGQIPSYVPKKFYADYLEAIDFLLSYKKNAETFKAYRRDVERFSQWCWFFAIKSFKQITREDLENFLQFCRKPPNAWIGKKNVAKFIADGGRLAPNPVWRPYVARVSKLKRSLGEMPKASKYSLSDMGFKMIFTALQRFYKAMVFRDYVAKNIVEQIRQKSHYYKKHQGVAKVRRVSPMQWEVVMEVAEQMAAEEPDKYERTLFVISMLYGMYLRVSELVASTRWTPMMHHFEKDYEDNWWFRTLGKGNKERFIAVSDAVLKSLKRWRGHLGTTTELPTPSDNLPLVCGRVVDKSIGSTRQVRNIIQACFDRAVEQLESEGHDNQAAELKEATVHWLRHTGISDDVKIRPREHVRDDAGHSSSLITDRYIDIDSRERHQSAKNKPM